MIVEQGDGLLDGGQRGNEGVTSVAFTLKLWSETDELFNMNSEI